MLFYMLQLLTFSGFMHLWGITLDTSSSVLLSVALGLAVDYSAHIAHAFMTTNGKSKDDRVQKAIIEMGPAVFNGGFSTFLAFSILMISKSFVFQVFFKIFFLVVVFGLFHGLVFLPVVLSFIGPPPSASVHATFAKGHGNNAIEPEQKGGDMNSTETVWTTSNDTKEE